VEELLSQEENSYNQKVKEGYKGKHKLHETLFLEEFHKSVYACSAETILFIENE
jgi:hypothetical protein